MIYTTIARILSPTQVVLAAGAEEGIKPGMEFVIYDLSDRIVDPESKEDLGQIELVKGRVIADHVQEKMTIASTRSRQITVNPFDISVFINRIETRHDELKVEGVAPIQNDHLVRVGDRVRSLTSIAAIPHLVSA
ncbi:MAG TPA: hypothetical protein VGL71_07390 [Urbifossiella sp.]|jgi:hypothetical protein